MVETPQKEFHGGTFHIIGIISDIFILICIFYVFLRKFRTISFDKFEKSIMI